MRTCWAGLLVVLVATVVGAAPSHAEKAFMAGGYITGGLPLGDWGKIAGFGLGLDQTDIVVLSKGKPLALRSSLGLHYNFSRTEAVPQSNLGPNSKLDLETKNWSVFFGLGPEFAKRDGDLRPFAFGTVGFDTYWTSSELFGTAGGAPFSAQHGDSRLGFAWSAGVGIRKPATEGLLAELSVEYRSGYGHSFLLPDEITNTGTVVNAQRDEHTTDQIIVRLGTLFGD